MNHFTALIALLTSIAIMIGKIVEAAISVYKAKKIMKATNQTNASATANTNLSLGHRLLRAALPVIPLSMLLLTIYSPRASQAATVADIGIAGALVCTFIALWRL